MNAVIEQMLAHRSIRRFTDEPVEEAHVAAAIEAGQMASTSASIQSYCIIRIRSEERRNRLIELTGNQTKVARCGAFFVVCGDTRRHRLLAERADETYDARFEAFLLAIVDATLFAQNVVLAFESLGYGACYIGGLRNDLPQVQELLGFPHGVYPLFGLCIGHPDQDPMRRPRLPLEQVLFEEQWPEDEAMLAAMDEYDQVVADYYQLREGGSPDATTPRRDWNSQMIEKFIAPRRVSVAPYYRQQGASLD